MADAKGLRTGWTKLDDWSDEIAAAINGGDDDAAIREFNTGGKGNADGSAGGAAGSSEEDIETVTGAVNGVPSTLNVLTDGSGWTAI